MKWFKHDSSALHDAKIEKLVMKYGIEGYGLYFACVEIIADNLSPEHFTFELEHDAELLAHKFKVDTLRVEEIMKYAVQLGLFEMNGNNRITCIKLAKRLDNTMAQNPEIRTILNNFKQLKVCDSRLDKIRLEENKERKDMSCKEHDDTHSETPKEKKTDARTHAVLEMSKKVIGRFNERMGTTYKPTTKATLRLISARMDEGLTEEEFYEAIGWCVWKWKKPPKDGELDMRDYIRPTTIFTAKMEAYAQGFKREEAERKHREVKDYERA